MISEAFDSDGFKKLLTEAIERRSKCRKCPIFSFCSGGCNNVALNENGIKNNMGTSCKIAIAVYQYIFNDIKLLKTQPELYNGNNPRIKQLLHKQRRKPDNHHDVHYDTL